MASRFDLKPAAGRNIRNGGTLIVALLVRDSRTELLVPSPTLRGFALAHEYTEPSV